MAKLEDDKREKTLVFKNKEKELIDKKNALEKLFQNMKIV
jgi:hypothetical protein